MPSPTHRPARSITLPNRVIKAEGAWFQQSHIGKSHPAPNARANALQQARQLPVSSLGVTHAASGANGPSPSLSTTRGSWTGLGPQPIDSTTCPSYCNNYGLNSGRITAEAVNPSNTNEIWVGAADGGLWHSTDGGAHWAPVTDGQPTLSIGSIAVDPGNNNTIYVGTGEANLNGDAYWGDGILKSTNDGATWTLLASNLFGGLGIAKIAVDPHNSNNVAVATNYDGFTVTSGASVPLGSLGVWVSTNAGASWTETLYSHSNSSTWGFDAGTDLVFDPAHTGVLYAGLGNVLGYPDTAGHFVSAAGIWKSTTSGQSSWTHVTSGVPSGTGVERVSLGISSDGTHVYAALTDSGTTGGAFGGLLNSAIYGSANSGATWQAMDISGVPNMANDWGENQWWYDSYVAVDPTNDNTVYVGGVDVWQTTQGVSSTSSNWLNLTNVYSVSPNGPHPDEHALSFLGNSANYIIGNDGGIWSGTKAGTWTNLNGGGLNITQFYGGSIGETGTGAQLYGGAQDNGEIAYPVGPVSESGPVQWNESYGGDGGNTAVDYYDNQTVYEETPGGQISKTTDGGATWNPATNGINPNDPVNFIAPFAHSQVNDSVLVMGTDKVYLTSDGAASWTPLSPVLDGSPISAVAVTSDTTIYAYDGVYAGTKDGHIFGITRAPGIWQTSSFSCPVSQVTSIAVDYSNPFVAYATCAGFANGSGQHVFKTTDGALHWTDISGALPNIPFESVAVAPASNAVVVGSDAGVFVTQDGGAHWAILGNGLPNAAINQVFFDHTGGALFVATHGRGMWEIPLPAFGSSPAVFNIATPAPGASPAPQTLTLTNVGFAPLNWSQTATLPSWLTVSPSSGTILGGGSYPLTLTFSIPPGDPAKTYSTSLTFTDPHATNSGYTVPVSVETTHVAKTWYFTEGYTGPNFSTVLMISNPGTSAAHVTATYLRDRNGPVTKSYTIPALSRQGLVLNSEVGAGYQVSTALASDQPIVAERQIYYTYTNARTGQRVQTGDNLMGSPTLASTYYFPVVDVRSGASAAYELANPSTSPIYATLAFTRQDGTSAGSSVVSIPAQTRITLTINHLLAPAFYTGTVSFSTAPAGTTPTQGMAERTTYVTISSTGAHLALTAAGTQATSPTWYFAEGYTGNGGAAAGQFHEYLELSYPAAPSAPAASVTLTVLKSDGTAATTFGPYTLAHGAQQELNINALLGAYTAPQSIVVTATQPILSERIMVLNYAGDDEVGAPTATTAQFFSEGYTGSGFVASLMLANPQTSSVAATVTLVRPEITPIIVSYLLAPQSRTSINLNALAPNQGFSIEVVATQPIISERLLYFNYGVTDALGYQP